MGALLAVSVSTEAEEVILRQGEIDDSKIGFNSIEGALAYPLNCSVCDSERQTIDPIPRQLALK